MNTMILPSGLIVPASPSILRIEADESTRLFNVAAWHQKKAIKADNVRDALRHTTMANDLFLQSHLAK